MTSTTCWSRAGRAPPPPSSPPTSSTASSSTARRSWSARASRRSATSASTRSPTPTAAGARRRRRAWHRPARSLRAIDLTARRRLTSVRVERSRAASGRIDMFTGIITDIGTVRSAEQRGDLRLTIACGYDLATVDLGASIACSGTCLTVVDKGPDWFAVDVSAETISRTAAGLWQRGRAPQPRTRAAPRRRAWRPPRHRPCRRRRHGRRHLPRRRLDAGSASPPPPSSAPTSPPRARSRSTACR